MCKIVQAWRWSRATDPQLEGESFTTTKILFVGFQISVQKLHKQLNNCYILIIRRLKIKHVIELLNAN